MITPIEAEKILSDHGVRPTAVRSLIYRAMSESHDTFSLTDLEERLPTVDKSTLFRTITLFTARHILHEIDDGTGSRKYCVCHNTHDCSPSELHVHFFCERCQKTYCLDSLPIPPVALPAGFRASSATYLLKGFCPRCPE